MNTQELTTKLIRDCNGITKKSVDYYMNLFHHNIKCFIESTENIPEEYKEYLLAKIIVCKLETREQILKDLESIK
jgi:hypothetical protein